MCKWRTEISLTLPKIKSWSSCIQPVTYQLSCHTATKPLNAYNKHVQYISTGESDTHTHMSLKQINKTQMHFKQRTSPFTVFLVYIINCHNNKQTCLHPEIHHNMYNMIQITTSVAPIQVKKINIFPVHNKHITRTTFCTNYSLSFITCTVRLLVLSHMETAVLFCML